MNHVPAIIQPHLIPFIYEEFQGGDVYYEVGVSKDIALYKSGSIGQILFRLIDAKPDERKIWLKIQVVPSRLRSHNYAFLSFDRSSAIHIPATDLRLINDLLEDILSTALVYYVLGRLKDDETKDRVQKAVVEFMSRYNLFDFEFTVQQMRQIYYRSKLRRSLLFRFQRKPGQQKIRSLIHVTGPGLKQA